MTAAGNVPEVAARNPSNSAARSWEQATPDARAAVTKPHGGDGDRERELREITDKLLEPRPGSLRATLDELRKFAAERLANLRKLISHPESAHQARAVMAEQFGKLILMPVRENGALSYAARSKVDFCPDTRGWCRGPESNWLRPPFQGGALPLSYPGTEQILETRRVRVKLSVELIILARSRRIRASSCDSLKLRAAWCLPVGPQCRLFP